LSFVRARRYLLAGDGHALASTYTFDNPDMVGLNPEVAHDTMAGVEFSDDGDSVRSPLT
jgi:hypothetical protein